MSATAVSSNNNGDLTGVLLTSVRSVGATRDRNARYRGTMEVRLFYPNDAYKTKDTHVIIDGFMTDSRSGLFGNSFVCF